MLRLKNHNGKGARLRSSCLRVLVALPLLGACSNKDGEHAEQGREPALPSETASAPEAAPLDESSAEESLWIRWAPHPSDEKARCQIGSTAEEAPESSTTEHELVVRFFSAFGQVPNLERQMSRAQRILSFHGIKLRGDNQRSSSVPALPDKQEQTVSVTSKSKAGVITVLLVPRISFLPNAAGLTFSPCLGKEQEEALRKAGLSFSSLPGPVILLGAEVLERTPPDERYDVLAHEIGHALGLVHVGGREHLMSPVRHTGCLPGWSAEEEAAAHQCLATKMGVPPPTAD